MESFITSDTSDSVAFASIPDNVPTKLMTEWTGKQFTRLLSSVMTGADLMFPNEADEIIWQLLKVIHQPIPFELPEEGGCVEYLPSAGFIKYFPDNPYISGDKSAGWNKEAWFRWGDFDTLFPDWIDNWISGFVGSLTGYEQNDILFNIESLPINPIDAFLNGGGVLPKIEIQFSGTGVIEVELLTFPLGGRAIIELDNEPNALDILTGGIIDPNSFLVELNRDILSFPPEEYPVLNVEIPVETAGNHVLYIVFLPSVDDSLLPIGFGGGIRSVELCGFEQVGNMGIEQIVWDGCQLKSITGGIETVIVTAAQIEACLDIPEGGGGGGSNLIVTALNNTTLTTVQDSNTAYDGTSRRATAHNFTRSKAWIRASLAVNNSTNGEDTLARISLPISGSMVVTSRNEGGMRGTISREIVIDAVYENIPSGNREVAVELMTSAGGGWIIPQNTIVTYTIVEFEDASDIFVEDIRIFEGELQKKIGGVWIAVSDSFEAIIQSLQSQVSAAAANAAAAVSTANNALTVAQGAVNVNNTQNTRLNALEAFQEDAELSLSQLSLTINDHETRIDALEAASGASPYFTEGVWAQNFNFRNGEFGFTATNMTWFNTVGYNFSGDASIGLPSVNILDSRITHVIAKFFRNGAGGDTVLLQFPSLTAQGQLIRTTGGGSLDTRIVKVPNFGAIYTPRLYFSNVSATHSLKELTFLGRGVNPFI